MSNSQHLMMLRREAKHVSRVFLMVVVVIVMRLCYLFYQFYAEGGCEHQRHKKVFNIHITVLLSWITFVFYTWMRCQYLTTYLPIFLLVGNWLFFVINLSSIILQYKLFVPSKIKSGIAELSYFNLIPFYYYNNFHLFSVEFVVNWHPKGRRILLDTA